MGTLLTRHRSALIAFVTLATACTVHQDNVPSLTGPSEFGQSVSITATPDSITQDGASQSAIVVTVRGPNGAGLSGVSLRLQMAVRGTVQDYGTLSAKTVATSSDGKATSVYTAPPPPPPPASGQEERVSIIVTATGSNFQTAISQTVDIRLVPTGVILPPAQTPNPSFTYSPQPALLNLPINFDASASCGGSSCASAGITGFAWSFGDGSTASGQTTTKTFDSNGSFNVTLTVTNNRGVSASTTQIITIGTGAEPSAEFVFSPAAPQVLQVVSFNASASRAAPGRTISRYAWDFGDSVTATGATTTHAFAVAGVYNVVLTVTDDLGQRGTTSDAVTVTAAGGGGGAPTTPTARFTFSPTAPAVNENVFFNGSTSTAGAGHSIASYLWVFGDGTGGTGVTPTHAYAASGTYNVQLTVTDEIGQVNTSATTAITIGNPPAPTANFTFSPTSPGRNDEVVFDASSSTTAQGQTIVDVAWNFGDGTAIIHCPGGAAADCPGPTNRISAHTFITAQTFVVNLVVTDSAGRTGSRNVNVTVVLAQPSVVITTSPGSPNPGNTVQFNSDGTTYFPGSGPASFAWTFGDGGTSTAANPTHVYASAGAYGVGLSVTDTKGRTGTDTATVTVVDPTPPPPPTPPVASFTFGSAMPRTPTTVVTFDGGGSTGANPLSYTWNFGDGIIEGPFASPTRTHTYVLAGAGSYSATLRVIDTVTGASNTSAAQTVTVVP